MADLFPIDPKPESLNLVSKQPVYNAISGSGKRQARINEGHLWQIQANYGLMLKDIMGSLYGFVEGHKAGSFEVILPDKNKPIGDITGSQTSGNASKGDTTVSMSGGSGTVQAGSIFKFASHTKVYMVTVNSTVGGTLQFRPPLIENIASSAISFVDVPFTVYTPDDILEWPTRSPELSTFSLNMEESIA